MQESSTITETEQPLNDTPVHRRSNSLRRFGITIALLVLAWAVFVYVLPRFFPMHPPVAQTSIKPQTAPVDAAQEKVAKLEARIAALEAEKTQAPQPAQVEQSAETAEALKSMQERLDSQEKQAQNLKQSLSGEQNQAWKMVSRWQAYDALATDMRSGEAFADALLRFENSVQDNKGIVRGIEELRPYADSGIVSLDFLKENFSDILPEVVHAKTGSSGSGLASEMAGSFSSLIRIRKVGMQEGASVEAIVARAEVALGEGKVKEALTEIDNLPEESKMHFSAWRENAQGYLLRENALDTIRRALMEDAEKAHTTGQQ